MELLLVLALTSIIMLIALPAFQNLLQSTLQQEVNRLSGVIRLLRNEAVLTTTRYRLMLFLKENRYYVERQDEQGTYATVTDTPVLAPHRWPSNLEMQELLLLGKVYHTDEQQATPVLVDESGYVDPFILHFSSGGDDYSLRVSGFTGHVELVNGHVEK
jgi:type II secretory pathway pseudopilin PulG